MLANIFLHLKEGFDDLPLLLEGLVAMKDASLGCELRLPYLLHRAFGLLLWLAEQDGGCFADLLILRLLFHVIIDQELAIPLNSSII